MRRALQSTFGFILIVSIVLQLLLIYSAWFAAPVIQQVEAQIGHSLSCNEVYDHREIENALYPEYSLLVNSLYLSNLCGPVWIGILLIISLGAGLVRRVRQRLSRLHWLLMGVMLALLVPILSYGSIIYKMACATE